MWYIDVVTVLYKYANIRNGQLCMYVTKLTLTLSYLQYSISTQTPETVIFAWFLSEHGHFTIDR